MRKMASIRKIDEIRPIDGADAIECAVVGGWTVVIKKGEFNVGDLAVYLEIDSWVPAALAPFLSKGKEPREYNGVPGERLRTAKLRGQLSQGLLLPYSVCGKICAEDEDVTELLNVQKWEKAIPAQLQGMMKGNFPSQIPKTDQERIQNLGKMLSVYKTMQWEVTEKLEGSSMTCYLIDGEFGVCSRNLDLKRQEENSFWEAAIRLRIEEKMRAVFSNQDVAIQGELIGPGIQGNIYGLIQTEFRVFDVYDIKKGEYYEPDARRILCSLIGLPHVPVINESVSLEQETIESILAIADGTTEVGKNKCMREGIVFKTVRGQASFKAVSNKYLLKHGD